MAINVVAHAGYTFTENEKVTTSKLNLLGLPTFDVTGTIENGDLAAGVVTPPKVTPGAYWYTATSGTHLAYAATFFPEPATPHADGLVLAMKIHEACGPSPTLEVNGQGPKKLKRLANQDLETNDLQGGTIIEVRYDAAGDSGGGITGTWQLVSPVSKLVEPVLPGSSMELLIYNNNTFPNSQIDITAVYAGAGVLLRDGNGRAFLAGGPFTVTLNMAASGVGGRDAGAGLETPNTWYYVYLIYNPTAQILSGVFSLNGAVPVLPSGYTYYAQVSIVFNNGNTTTPAGNLGDIKRFYQVGRNIGTDNVLFFTGKTHADGTTWAPVASIALPSLAIDRIVPPNAKSVRGIVGTTGLSTGATNITERGLIQLAGDANGPTGLGHFMALGLCAYGAVSAGYSLAWPFEIPMRLTQNFYWIGAPTTMTWRMEIAGYTI